MMKNNKGVGMGMLVAIILTIAALVPVTFFTVKYAASQRSGIGMRECQISILKAAQEKKISGGNVFSRLHCQRDNLGDLVIKKEDVIDEKTEMIDQDKASRIIADAMASCWQMVGEGKIDPFSNWEKEGSYCMICKTIRFDEELKKYYKESLTDKDKLDKRGEKSFITSPIPYMIKPGNRWLFNQKNYFEYIYGVKDPNQVFSEEEIDSMEKMIVTDNSVIMLKMYKHNDKDSLATLASYGALILGGLMVIAGGVLIFTGVGFVIGIPLGAAGKYLMAIGGVSLLLSAGTFGGILIFDPVNLNPFSECEDCNGIGSLKIIPAEFDLRQEVTVTYPAPITRGGEEIVEQGAYCDHLIN